MLARIGLKVRIQSNNASESIIHVPRGVLWAFAVGLALWAVAVQLSLTIVLDGLGVEFVGFIGKVLLR